MNARVYIKFLPSVLWRYKAVKMIYIITDNAKYITRSSSIIS
ncbi:MAG: hypothetical protein Q6370_012380 [Candidatus Sigynarchaeota archaeon]